MLPTVEVATVGARIPVAAANADATCGFGNTRPRDIGVVAYKGRRVLAIRRQYHEKSKLSMGTCVAFTVPGAC
jgi:hypothetical protein